MSTKITSTNKINQKPFLDPYYLGFGMVLIPGITYWTFVIGSMIIIYLLTKDYYVNSPLDINSLGSAAFSLSNSIFLHPLKKEDHSFLGGGFKRIYFNGVKPPGPLELQEPISQSQKGGSIMSGSPGYEFPGWMTYINSMEVFLLGFFSFIVSLTFSYGIMLAKQDQCSGARFNLSILLFWAAGLVFPGGFMVMKIIQHFFPITNAYSVLIMGLLCFTAAIVITFSADYQIKKYKVKMESPELFGTSFNFGKDGIFKPIFLVIFIYMIIRILMLHFLRPVPLSIWHIIITSILACFTMAFIYGYTFVLHVDPLTSDCPK